MSLAVIRPRRGTLAEWTLVNPIIAEGEFVIEIPNDGIGTGICRFKLGDGVTAYNDLEYAFEGFTASAIYGGTVTNWSEIYIRSGTTEEWTEADPVLGLGEITLDTTTGKIKIGDGTSTWTELNYYNCVISYTEEEWESTDYILAEGEIGYDSTNGMIKIGDGTSTWSELSYYGKTSIVSHTEEEWLALEEEGEVLDEGIIAYNSTNGQFKFSDGTSTWSDLEYYYGWLESATTEEWEEENEVLGEGQVVYDSTTGKIKIGDGTSTWSELDYYGATVIVNTSEEWTESDTVLQEGEIGYESDTGLIKIGDGTSTWSELEYVGLVTTDDGYSIYDFGDEGFLDTDETE